MQEKAYKLLAIQERISNREAKDLIDKGCVFSYGKKIVVARALMNENTKFNIVKNKKSSIIFEDDKIIAVNKSYNVISQDLEKQFKAKLLNRLDKGTSGVILLCKDDEFKKLCIQEFKKQRVLKTYIAILDGVLAEELMVNEPLISVKSKSGTFTKVSKEGLSAISIFKPLMIEAKKTLAKIEIKTGRTHQIRVHSVFIKHGVIGDEKYSKIPSDRMYLHSYEIKLLGYHFRAKVDESFAKFGFEIKNIDF